MLILYQDFRPRPNVRLIGSVFVEDATVRAVAEAAPDASFAHHTYSDLELITSL